MHIGECFEADEVRLVEPFFSDLCYTEMDELILSIKGDMSRILIDENDEIISFAVDSSDGTIHASCFHLRTPSDAVITRFEAMDGEVYQVPRAEFEDGVRKYYTEALRISSTVAPNDLNPERLAITRELVHSAIDSATDITCLDCCCGTGIRNSTSARSTNERGRGSSSRRLVCTTG